MTAAIAHGEIVDRVVAECLADPQVADIVERGRSRPMPESKNSMVVVRKLVSRPTVTAMAGAPVDWLTIVRVGIYARDKVISGDEAADVVLGKVYERLMSSTALLAGGELELLPPDLDWDEDDQDSHNGGVSADFKFRHRTTANTLEPQP